MLGPLLGGLLADWVGMRMIFLLVGFLFLAVTLLTWFGIEEEVQVGPEKVKLSTKEVLSRVQDKQVLFGLLNTSLVINAAAQSVVPILTLYVRHLGQTDNLLFVSGLITSAVGISSMMSSAFLGKLGDRIGNHRLLLMGLAYSFVIHLLFTQAQTPLQLGLFRFLYCFGTGSLLPSFNSLLTKITPKEGVSRVFAYSQTFGSLGVVLGPMLGSGVATIWGYEWVFYMTSLLVLFNLIWSLFYFRPYMKVKEIV